MADSKNNKDPDKTEKATPRKRAATAKATTSRRSTKEEGKSAPGSTRKTGAPSRKKTAKPKTARKTRKEENTLSDAKASPETNDAKESVESTGSEIVDRVLAFIFYGILGVAIVHIYLILCVIHFVLAAATGEIQKEFQDFLFRMRNWLVEIGDYFSLRRSPRDFPFPAPGTKFPNADK